MSFISTLEQPSTDDRWDLVDKAPSHALQWGNSGEVCLVLFLDFLHRTLLQPLTVLLAR